MSYSSRRIRAASKAKILRVGELAAAAEAREREAWPEALPLPSLFLDSYFLWSLFLHVSSNFTHDITIHHLSFKRGVSYMTEAKHPSPRQTRNASSWRGRSRRFSKILKSTDFFAMDMFHWTWSLHSCVDLFCQIQLWHLICVQSVIAWDFLRVSWSSPSMPTVLIQNMIRHDSTSFISDP